MRESRTRAQPLRPPCFLEGREQAALAFMADEVRDARERTGPVVRTEGWDREGERDVARLADWSDVEPGREEPFAKEWRGDAKTLGRAPLDRREPGSHEALQGIQGLAAEHHEVHQVR